MSGEVANTATIKTFEDMKLYPWIIRQLATLGIKTPTPIQQNCIPEILDGKNCIGAAKTGSGKTLAFAIPILQQLSEDPYSIYSLILTTTRELALQINEQLQIIGKLINLKTCLIIGGQDMIEQARELQNHPPHIIIATPGRLADHLSTSSDIINLEKIKFLVLDEADKLLSSERFQQQLKIVFEQLPKSRQSLCFSATINDTLLTLKHVIENRDYERAVFVYEAPNGNSNVATVEQLQQYYLLCPVDVKDAYFIELLRKYRQDNPNSSIIVFVDTCYNCHILSMVLNKVGFPNLSLHAMMKQKERFHTLNKFKSNHMKILIATDIASRGLDIPKVELIINYNIPEIQKDYLHRVGRTARAGRSGKAITLITPYDIKLLHAIEEFINTKLEEYKVDDKAVAEICLEVNVTKSECEIELDKTTFFEKKMINLRKKWIMDGLDPDEEEKKYFSSNNKISRKNKINKKQLKRIDKKKNKDS